MPKSSKSKVTKNTTRVELIVEPRKLFGKKVKKLRSVGYLPATVYGPDFESKSIQIKIKDFLNVYKKVHETGIVFIKYGSLEIPTLIKNLQRDPIEDLILHTDFRKIDLGEKMITQVPIKVIERSEAVEQKGGVLLTHVANLSIEALPQDIPSAIEIDISKLKEIGQEIKIADLAKTDKYTFKDPSEKVLVSIIAHKEESVTPETAAPITEVTTEKAPEEEAVKEEAPVKEEEAKPKAEEKKK